MLLRSTLSSNQKHKCKQTKQSQTNTCLALLFFSPVGAKSLVAVRRASSDKMWRCRTLPTSISGARTCSALQNHLAPLTLSVTRTRVTTLQSTHSVDPARLSSTRCARSPHLACVLRMCRLDAFPDEFPDEVTALSVACTPELDRLEWASDDPFSSIQVQVHV